jgi:hypothetical protein
MKHSEALLLALGALLLSALIEVAIAKPQAKGMMWTSDDQAKPIAMQGIECPGFVIASNTLDQTDHGVIEGYFAVGASFEGFMRPVDPRYAWVKQHRGQPVDIVIRVRELIKPEVIK